MKKYDFLKISGSLSIKDSQETDQGDYECVAENSKGTEYSYEAKLYVRGMSPYIPRMI